MSDFANSLRENRIPSTREMSLRSIQRYEQAHGEITADLLRNNFSQILSGCIRTERALFEEVDHDIRGSWARDLLSLPNRKTRFPTISGMVDNALGFLDNKDMTNEQKLSAVTQSLEEINAGLSLSQQNSAKQRSGSAFENYLERFFDILQFRYERQQTLASGEKLDLVFPNLQTMNSSPQDCIMMECQTTLKDRFRLSLGKGQSLPGIAKFIATATGCNLITDKDHNDLTQEKIDEIRDKQYRLVALQQVAQRWNNPTVISFEDFVQIQYLSRSGLW